MMPADPDMIGMVIFLLCRKDRHLRHGGNAEGVEIRGRIIKKGRHQ